jgi:hypothetical protein
MISMEHINNVITISQTKEKTTQLTTEILLKTLEEEYNTKYTEEDVFSIMKMWSLKRGR